MCLVRDARALTDGLLRPIFTFPVSVYQMLFSIISCDSLVAKYGLNIVNEVEGRSYEYLVYRLIR